MNLEDLAHKIKTITSSEYHEGGFGSHVDIRLLPELVLKNNNLSDYVVFLDKFGYGELDASFFVEEQPAKWSTVFPIERSYLEGLYIFASDQSEYSYAFNINEDCKVFEIAADGELSKFNLGTFDKFIQSQLSDLVDIVNWRNDNL